MGFRVLKETFEYSSLTQLACFPQKSPVKREKKSVLSDKTYHLCGV